jgi:hypothetical protein
MRHARRKPQWGHEFGGSGEDSFVAVVVTKLTGALLFILLLTMVIMALIPKAVDPAEPANRAAVSGDARSPLRITTPAVLPEVIAGRPYTVALAAAGGSGEYRWSIQGELPPGLAFNPASACIEGTAEVGTPQPVELAVTVRDQSSQLTSRVALTVYRPEGALSLPSWIFPRLPVIPWRSWLEQGFGFLLLALMHLLGMNALTALQRWATRRVDDVGNATAVRSRFVLYRSGVRLASLSAGLSLCAWLWSARP